MELEQESLDELRASVGALEAANAALLDRMPQLRQELQEGERELAALKTRQPRTRKVLLPTLVGCCVLVGAVSLFMAFSNAPSGPGFRVAGAARAIHVTENHGEEDCQVTIASMERPLCDFFAVCGSEQNHFRGTCPEIGAAELRLSQGDVQRDLRVTQISWQAHR